MPSLPISREIPNLAFPLQKHELHPCPHPRIRRKVWEMKVGTTKRMKGMTLTTLKKVAGTMILTTLRMASSRPSRRQYHRMHHYRLPCRSLR